MLFAAILPAGLAVRSAAAQAATSRARDAGFNADSLMVWASVALGPSVQSGFERAAGVASIWSTYRSMAFSVRQSGTSQVLEPGSRNDISVLYGRRAPTKLATIVVGIGVGISGGKAHSSFVPLPNETVLAVGGEADIGGRFVGVGLSAFGTFGQTRHYGGIGIGLALGRLK